MLTDFVSCIVSELSRSIGQVFPFDRATSLQRSRSWWTPNNEIWQQETRYVVLSNDVKHSSIILNHFIGVHYQCVGLTQRSLAIARS